MSDLVDWADLSAAAASARLEAQRNPGARYWELAMQIPQVRDVAAMFRHADLRAYFAGRDECAEQYEAAMRRALRW